MPTLEAIAAGGRLPMSALSRVGISGSDGPAGSEVESVDDPHDESSWAPMTRCDPPQDGSGVLIDHQRCGQEPSAAEALVRDGQ